MKIAVGIATIGRRDILSQAVKVIAEQARLPDRLVISVVNEKDVDTEYLKQFPVAASVVQSAIGSAAQRNRIITELFDADVVVFFDDDFFPCNDYLVQIERIFLAHDDVMATTGRPIEDGINGPGLGVEHARSVIAQAAQAASSELEVTRTVGTYGCNMAFRLAPIREHAILFDENLPLYAWQEDIDFSAQVARYGRVIESSLLKGVHLGNKGARSSGVRFGYSQIANPVYLARKGTMGWSYALSLMCRNLAANLLRSANPEPWVDRRGRLKGNALALLDVATGRVRPGRILQLG
ncbi:glucosyll transferase family 2 [Bradyrhizobium sp. NP1]|uniref:glycosyltransferase family 2 protein n=1 Tax=Bradyrhizobium sp. NP1 TaxID=3049772 RepID=UPI0025A60BBC|nr:glucosyll transferase family 2 [Bradyrhizobium sp. NP1]WJR81407.1 glucosyll transferase family 2 [Bradyrhizobium sp. NP1]